jgi:hypothetical protein
LIVALIDPWIVKDLFSEETGRNIKILFAEKLQEIGEISI